MELSALTGRLRHIVHAHFHSLELTKLLHHTGLMLTQEELEIFTIVRPLTLFSLLEQPVK